MVPALHGPGMLKTDSRKAAVTERAAPLDLDNLRPYDPAENTWNTTGPWRKHIPTGELPQRSGGAEDVNENTVLPGSEGNVIHRIASSFVHELGERLGRMARQFEPGTSFYLTVVEHARAMAHGLRTRDDVDRMVRLMELEMVPHLATSGRAEFAACKAAIANYPAPLSVDAFKEGFAEGNGEASRDR